MEHTINEHEMEYIDEQTKQQPTTIIATSAAAAKRKPALLKIRFATIKLIALGH